ncbi:hypothetical protein BpHYR1_019430 [Brachionus plicatilis]|uniref:Uncharacterized protein n=1 Tax=Brachionus plicatilis TaxID=10195 RepID=A0A3M7PDS1_BRAPC|nr:hypothetical protein BpHYR1_019430 [Brachionus plicatilis]
MIYDDLVNKADHQVDDHNNFSTDHSFSYQKTCLKFIDQRIYQIQLFFKFESISFNQITSFEVKYDFFAKFQLINLKTFFLNSGFFSRYPLPCSFFDKFILSAQPNDHQINLHLTIVLKGLLRHRSVD